MKRYISVLLLGLSSFLVAQTPKFSKNPVKFIDEYQTAISKTANDLQKQQLSEFVTLWNGSTLSKPQKIGLMKTMMNLADKRQRPVPTMLQVGNVLNLALSKKSASAQQLDSLTQALEYVSLEGDPKQIDFFLTTTENYFAENLLFKTKFHAIYATSNAFNFTVIKDAFADGGGFDFVEIAEAPTEEEPIDLDSFEDWDTQEDNGTWGDTWESETPALEPTETTDQYSDEFVDALYDAPEVTLSGPALSLTNSDLLIVSGQDSVRVQNTTGNLSLLDGTFVGQGGSFDWTSAGLEPEVKATFDAYSFNVRKAELSAQDVKMVYPSKVDGEMSGIFQYKTTRRKSGTLPSYPRFMSYKNDIVIKDFGANIKYQGGFALNGNKVFSSCVSGAPSTLTVSDSGVVKFKAQAKYFELGDSTLNSNPSRVILYFGEDSITHPGVRMTYQDNLKKLVVRKDVTVFKEASFANSFHVLEMDVDEIRWDLQDTLMTMAIVGAKNEVPAFFKSETNFSEKEYIHLKGYFPFHPLQMVMNYTLQKRTKDFSVYEIATYYEQRENTMFTAILSLQKKGMVHYNSKTGTVSITDKAIHFYQSRRQKIDYDILSVRSIAPPRYNATLNLKNQDLIVEGVDEVILSDSNDVKFYPKNRQLTFQKNRNILFDGEVTTNNYVFNGREFKFSYDSFNLDLANIDSIEFSIEVFDTITQTTKREKIENKLSYSEGTLTIDESNNRSGVKNNPRYPHFNADHGAAVVFNKAHILDGVYDTSFRYQIPPFSVDSLSDDIENTVSFDGEFYSGGVFPAIKEPLEIQKDRGFGFTHQVPEKGYELYGGHARFFGTITMGSKGLRGDGTIKYLNTTLESMDFVFYKDSVKGLGDIATTVMGAHPDAMPGVTFPECQVTDYEMSWYPSLDSMHITNYDNAFHLYNGVVDLSGSLAITTAGMKGAGIAESQGSLTISNHITFRESSFSATQGQFEILSDVIGKPALRSDYVNIELDLKAKKATFSPAKEGYASNNFPYLQYRTSLNNGLWDMEKRIVTMQKPAEMDIKDSYFYSTRKSQDSLAFNAVKAYYLIDSLKLKVEGVDSIQVADAEIYPVGSRLEIKENAQIVTLKGARIGMDTVNKYHNLVGDIDIRSSKDFDGSANYQYVNYLKDTLEIVFSEFKLEPIKNKEGKFEYHTVCRGVIEQEASFSLAPQMIFKGDVVMYAHQKLLSLDGYIKLDLHGRVESPDWLRFQNNEDDEQIKIDLERQENKEDINLTTGLFYSADVRDYYAVFLKEPWQADDQKALWASGYLTHDNQTNEFSVVNKDIFNKKSFKGNSFGYIEQNEAYVFKGEINLINPSPEIIHNYSFKFGGQGEDHLIDSTLELSGTGALRFEIPSQLLNIFGSKMAKMGPYCLAGRAAKISDTTYRRYGAIGSQKEIQRYVKATANRYQNPAKTFADFKSAIVLNDLNLTWDRAKRAWHSSGPIGFVNVGGNDVNSYAKAFLEIKKTPQEDQINFYVEPLPNVWYYFSYVGGALYVSSSDENFNDYVQSKNTEAKNLPKGLYYWTLGDEEGLARFKKRFVNDYLEGKEYTMQYATVPQNLIDANSATLQDDFNTNTARPDEFEDQTNPSQNDSEPSFLDDAPSDNTNQTLPDVTPGEVKRSLDPFEETEPTPTDQGKKKKKKSNKNAEKIPEQQGNLNPDSSPGSGIVDPFEEQEPEK